jgi:hypothetical protein
MSAKNVKTLRAAHESWNKRDFAGVINNAAEGLAYTDHGRNTTLNTQRSLESGPKDGPRHSRTAALPIPSTLTQETLWSPSSPSKAPTMGHSVQ